MGKRWVKLLAIIALLAVPMSGAALAQEAQPLRVGATVGLSLVADGLQAPLSLKVPHDGTGRRFIVEQTGQIRVLTADGRLLPEPFLDVADRLSSSGGERGLLGLAFHPDYADNGRFFVYYSAVRRPEAPTNFSHTSHISEFRVSDDDPNVADPDSERIILQVDQPQANHNAGDVEFGPDGYLYITLGDGGGANDSGTGHTPGLGNGQDTSNLLGSILRLDVDSGDPYGIPPDNPFVGSDDGLDEIFAYGFRNPFRMNFDGDDLYVADVGQNRWEEVNLVVKGGNYGWNRKEATDCFDPANPNDPPATCTGVGPFGEPLIDPIIEYPQRDLGGLGVAVIGGFVYRGNDLPGLRNRYVFGDFSGGSGAPGTLLTAHERRPGELWHLSEIRVAGRPDGELGEFVRGFGMGIEGELYVLTQAGGLGGGHVYQLVHPARPAARGSNRVFVTLLSGDEEVPPVDTRAKGVATFTLSQDGSSIDYRLNVSNINDVMMAHIHVAPRGVNGGVAVWLYPEDGPPPQLIPGVSNGTLATGTITADDLVGPLAGSSIAQLHSLMMAGQTYVNVHTSANPGGEIRGQL